jgi:hypothetical protein
LHRKNTFIYGQRFKNKESLQALTVAEITDIFHAKMKFVISNAPRAGVTPETYRALKNGCNKLIDFLGGATRVDHLNRNVFMEYKQW